MDFRIADTFIDSLAKLSGQEQKAVKTTAFDLQMNPSNPAMQFHKLENTRDPNFWSIRVNLDIRLIVHRTNNSLLLCYVNHHDKAYRWVEKRKLEIHPKTGAAQLVEIRETIEEITVPRYVEQDQPLQPKSLLFSGISDNDLLSWGIPPEWLNDVRQTDEGTILDLADHLPKEAAEALLDLATGVKPHISPPITEGIDPFNHPDAQRRFRVMNNSEELERALEYPWEKWIIFLHPAQRELVEQEYSGPARVSGSAGTGKTIVALHRAVFLARKNPDARILLTTFSETLANALRMKLRRLIVNEPKIAERLEVHAINAIGQRLYRMHFGSPNVVTRENLRNLLEEAAKEIDGQKFSLHFLLTEWEQVVDAWQLETWEAYRDVLRLGRKTRLPEKQREMLWKIFEQVKSMLRTDKLVTYPEIFHRLTKIITENNNPPFDFIVVDEAQDLSVAQLRFLAAMGTERLNGLFFAGDLGQRIFQQPFSWKSLGVDIRGRSRTLKINYRTSHQIRMQADKLLGPELTDVDGNREERKGTISVFNGQKPTIAVFNSPEEEGQAISKWISDRINDGILAHEIGVFVRSKAELDRAVSAASDTGLSFNILDENLETTAGHVSISTMHLAKGLEFRAVAVMACDDEVIPLQERIETITDDSDLEEVYNTERHLLYVACTRARDYLIVTGVDPVSEFIDDMRT